MTKKISAVYCLCVTGFFMISILLRAFTQNILIKKIHMNNGFTKTVFFDRQLPPAQVPINWAKQYPFQADSRSSIAPTRIFVNFKNKVTNIEKKIEQYTTETLLCRVPLVETAVRYEYALGWKLHESVIDLGDGYLTETIKKADVTSCAESLSKFSDFLAKRHIDLLYVQCPYKICKHDAVSGDFSNANADSLLAALDERRISCLDLRKCLHTTPMSASVNPAQYHHSLFYKTDHHWKAETGLWATGILAEYLNARNGFNINTALFAPDRYRYDVYENWFLGSIGRKVTLARTQPENIRLLYPEFDTDFSFQIPSRDIAVRGDFSVIYDNRQFGKKDYYIHIPYSAYTYGDNPVTVIHNNFLHTGKKLLFIKDSFVSVVAPFMALGVENIDMLDLRAFTGSVRTYIVQSKPDIVVVMYNPSTLNISAQMFDFR